MSCSPGSPSTRTSVSGAVHSGTPDLGFADRPRVHRSRRRDVAVNDVFRTAPNTAPGPPREVTPDIVEDSAVHGRFLRLFGNIWAGVGLFLTLLFGLAVLLFGLHGPVLFAG